MRKILIPFIFLFFISCVKEDIEPPVIQLNGDQNIQMELFGAYNELGAVATDNEDGDITEQIDINNLVETAKLGKYEVLYVAKDRSGNTAVKRRNVEVVFYSDQGVIMNDNESPVITLFGMNPHLVNKDSVYLEPGYQAIDNVYGDITDLVETSGNVNSSVLGDYYIQYTVADFSGNISYKDRIISVIEDNDPPIITLRGPNPLNLPLMAIYHEEGANAWDDVWGDLTPFIEINGNVNTQVQGSYTITYTVEDKSGNNATADRTVNVGP